MRNMLCLSVLVALLAGCSSAPEPVPVEWDKPADSMNGTLPQWTENNAVIPASMVTGHWSQHIASFNPENIFTPAVSYAVAHSSQVTVSAPDSERYFTAKTWLRQGGYKGLIEFSPKDNCFNCNTTEIFFYR
ncbi:cag pathogenicity island Cag12 family protein [Buttiauxella ferragutiae]|uniref:cag pathogenicity island Cag12 family protein n=1 Tax=Buttiauxella ferragutiae TaxID=82989 RepID=UPI0035265011